MLCHILRFINSRVNPRLTGQDVSSRFPEMVQYVLPKRI